MKKWAPAVNTKTILLDFIKALDDPYDMSNNVKVIYKG